MSYARFVSTAKRLIAAKGAALTHTTKGGAYSAATGTFTPSGATQTGFGLMTGGKVRNKGASSSTISSPQEMYVSTEGIVTPFRIGDEISFNGKAHTIVTVDNIAPDGTVILWILGLSSGE